MNRAVLVLLVVVALLLVLCLFRIAETKNRATCSFKVQAIWSQALTQYIEDSSDRNVQPAQLSTDIANLAFAADRLNRVDALCSD